MPKYFDKVASKNFLDSATRTVYHITQFARFLEHRSPSNMTLIYNGDKMRELQLSLEETAQAIRKLELDL